MVLKGNRTDTSIVLTKRLTSPNQRQWKLGKSFEAQTKSPQLWNVKQTWTPLRVNMSKSYIKHDHRSKEPLLHSWSWLPQFFSIKLHDPSSPCSFYWSALVNHKFTNLLRSLPYSFLTVQNHPNKKKKDPVLFNISPFLHFYVCIYKYIQHSSTKHEIFTNI